MHRYSGANFDKRHHSQKRRYIRSVRGFFVSQLWLQVPVMVGVVDFRLCVRRGGTRETATGIRKSQGLRSHVKVNAEFALHG